MGAVQTINVHGNEEGGLRAYHLRFAVHWHADDNGRFHDRSESATYNPNASYALLQQTRGSSANSSRVGHLRIRATLMFSLTFTIIYAEQYSFPEANIRILCDEPDHFPPGIAEEPTCRNIIRAMRWLVKGAKADDSLVFYCE